VRTDVNNYHNSDRLYDYILSFVISFSIVLSLTSLNKYASAVLLPFGLLIVFENKTFPRKT
jgi:hypothetical protein